MMVGTLYAISDALTNFGLFLIHLAQILARLAYAYDRARSPIASFRERVS